MGSKLPGGEKWRLEETQYHINYLEVFFAIQTFARDKKNITIQVQTDNKSATTYINRIGGTRSPPLSKLARRTWDWCMERRIHLIGEYLPGSLNVIADWESRMTRDDWDWKLNPLWSITNSGDP
jgi:hypothetical protein